MPAGLALEQMLADDLEAPRDPRITFALATDDLMVFAVNKISRARKLVDDTQRACADDGIQNSESS